MMNRRNYVKNLALTGIACAAGGPRTLLAQPGKSPQDVAGAGSLKAHAAGKGLFVGCAIGPESLRDERSRKVILEQFNMIVPDRCLKFGSLRPTPETYDFTDADFMVDFAVRNGLALRGHNFVWHENVPKWFAAYATKENARKIFTEHILAVGTRYRGKMQSWDVVNEVILAKEGLPNGLRNTPWLNLIGPGYIELAFQTARQADPHAKLTYNEFGIESESDADEAQRRAVLALLRRLKAADAPIDAFGLESHQRAGSEKFGPRLRTFLEQVSALGLEIYLTEIDMNDDDIDNDDFTVRDKAVAEAYGNYLHVALENPNVRTLVTWGVFDDHSWLNNPRWHKKHPTRSERACMFGADDAAKPAFFAVRDAIDQMPARLAPRAV